MNSDHLTSVHHYRENESMVDYPFDCGFNAMPREALKEALFEGGPHHAEIASTEVIERMKFENGCYKIDPALTYVPESGGRYAVYRWRVLSDQQ